VRAMRNVSSSGSHSRNNSFTQADAACACECADPYLPTNEKPDKEATATARVLQFNSHSPDTQEILSHLDQRTALTPHHLLFRHSWSYRVAKRMLDLVLAIALLPFFVPICLLLMLLIKCGSKGPVFYRHLRVGQDSRGFHLYKFRTMFLDSDTILKDYLATDPGARQEWDERYKLRRDPRVTPLGAILRRTSLDELPQIVNVLLGHMSFVGPRPIVHDEVCRYGGAFALYAAAKPGITGLWQVSGRGTLPYEMRVSLDIKYVTTWSFLHDLRVLLKTARVVCNSEGAY
jgi:exopolysaccharide production protein ExoY